MLASNVAPAPTHVSRAQNTTTPHHQSHSRRQSYTLPPQPFDIPFQSSVDNAAAQDSRSLRSVETSRRLSRPPTQNGGPLSSHPTSHNDNISLVPGAFPASLTHQHRRLPDGAMSSESARDNSGSFVAPNSTISPPENQTPERRPSTVRRLFSLSSLRQSFSSSRTSFTIPPASSHGNRHDAQERPQTAMSYAPSTVQAPSMYSTNKPSTLRKRRTSNWFKRKSGFFAVNEDGRLDVVDEDSADPRAPKRFKESTRLPMLPEVSTLLELNEGSLGWDEELFKR